MRATSATFLLGLFAAAAVSAAPALKFGKSSPQWEAATDFSKAAVYVATNATVPEIEAARLVMRTTGLLAGKPDSTNVMPEVAAALPNKGIVIGWQGSDLVKPFAEQLGLKSWWENDGRDIIGQYTVGDRLFLVGNSPEGAYYAAADFLYHNGARFIHTGCEADNWDGGTFLEFVKALKAPLARRYSPPVMVRTGFALGEIKKRKTTDAQMIARNQFAVRNGTSPAGPLDGGYSRDYIGCECIQPLYNDFHKTPDFFPMIDGKRWRPPPGGMCWVVEGCWSNPDFTRWVVERIAQRVEQAGPQRAFALYVLNSDGGRGCECPECLELRASYPDSSSRFFDYQGGIVRELKKRYPGMYVESAAYQMSREYPKQGNAVLAGQDAIDYCPYSRCYVHRYDDESCRTNQRERERMREWREKSGLRIGDYDYLFDMFLPAMGVPVWELAAEAVQHMITLNGEDGVPRIYAEAATAEGGVGGKSRIAAYVFARTLWDDSRSADEHLQDYCKVGYGPAADVMLDYHRACAVAWTNQPAHVIATFSNPLGTGKSYFTAALQAKGAKAFVEAEALILRELARAGAPDDRLAVGRNLAHKQLATLRFEKQCFDEWVALRARARTTSMEINLEYGDDSPQAFDRMPRFPMKAKAAGVEDVTKSTVQCYRTGDALRIRVTSQGPAFKKHVWKETRVDSENAWLDNSMEFFVQFVGQGDYYHLAVSATGDCYDGRALDGSFDSDLWKVDNLQQDGLWQLTLTIPYRLFGDIAPKDGDTFKLIAANNSQKLDNRGQPVRFEIGLPYPAHHDIAIGVDLRIDESNIRRASD